MKNWNEFEEYAGECDVYNKIINIRFYSDDKLQKNTIN